MLPFDPFGGGPLIPGDGSVEEGGGEVDAGALEGAQDVDLSCVDPYVAYPVLEHEIHHLRRDQSLGALPPPGHADEGFAGVDRTQSYQEEGDGDWAHTNFPS